VNRFSEALVTWTRFLESARDEKRGLTAPFVAEATYHAGLCELRVGLQREGRHRLVSFAADVPAHALAPAALIAAGESYLPAQTSDADARRVAIEILERVLKSYPDHAEIARIAYVIGDSWLFAGDTAKAVAAYERFIRLFPQNDRAAEARYTIAQAYARAANYDAARTQWSRFLGEYPSSSLWRDAQNAIEDSWLMEARAAFERKDNASGIASARAPPYSWRRP
jgi:outer membrane protein assembly factor BamD (BamD/ComL family)